MCVRCNHVRKVDTRCQWQKVMASCILYPPSTASASTPLNLTPECPSKSTDIVMKNTGYPERLGLIEDTQLNSSISFTGSDSNLGPILYAGPEHSTSVDCSLLQCHLCKDAKEQYHFGVSDDAFRRATLTQQAERVACRLVTVTHRRNDIVENESLVEPLESPSISRSCSVRNKKTDTSEVQVCTQLVSAFRSSSPEAYCKRSFDHSQLSESAMVSFGPDISAPTAIGNSLQIVEQDHEVHIWTERERRKKMRSMFVTLHSMLPNSSAKADKSTIVDEAISYIKSLEQNLQKLLKRKAERANNPINVNNSLVVFNSFSSKKEETSSEIEAAKCFSSNMLTKDGFLTWCSSNVVLNICAADAFFTICTVKRAGLLSEIFTCIVERHKLEVHSVQISNTRDLSKRLYMIHAQFFQDFQSACRNLKMTVEDLTICILKHA
ncbi:hypothetical protein O6H91_06G046700 [Diphasiastrum complanatum]|uniref:Uncharacterized protein n=1 Tax=Diphasiastrum complanatum TaxID=34168 RepID=A0ACC2DDC0_DIPCM|nr:hypothetical protein O6H91_06G046700 [Diphasiastrum complanatum]